MGAAPSMEASPGSPEENKIINANKAPLSGASSILINPEWRKILKNKVLSHHEHRKMKAQALGRRTAAKILINNEGFSLHRIRICEGQVITFLWNDSDGGRSQNVIQVVDDGDQLREVVGGFNSGKISRSGKFEQQFNLAGEYKFRSAGVKCVPLVVEVYERKDIESIVSDEGFDPRIMRLDEGNSVRWSWSACTTPHSVVECVFSHATGHLIPKENQPKQLAAKAGTSRKIFNKPGMYYFQTESPTSGVKHTCIVHARERQREYKISVEDEAFDPPILVIEEGDRVWWEWTRGKCAQPHCIYETEIPPLGSKGSNESYKLKKRGFKWPNATKSGLLSHEFFEPGVYYYSDKGYASAANYMGTIIVKPKLTEHFIDLTKAGFDPEVVHAHTGDLIWWMWLVDEVDPKFVLSEIEKCISPSAKQKPEEREGSYMTEELESQKVDVNLELVVPSAVGVYHYRPTSNGRVLQNQGDSGCSVIVNSGPKNHTIHVTDSGFEPKVTTIFPGDKVWWVWQEGEKSHNIAQVSHDGRIADGGFSSGVPVDCPSAFMTEFDTPGVYYYKSDGIDQLFGAIVVTNPPMVHEIAITPSGVDPDPLIANVDDVVAWTFTDPKHNDLTRVKTLSEAERAVANVPDDSRFISRKCLSRAFSEEGVFHFSGKPLLRKNDGRSEMPPISTVIIGTDTDGQSILVDKNGFNPSRQIVRRGRSVLFDWKKSDAAHNVVHVNSPSSNKPLTEIEGEKAFNSGPLVPRGSFLHTFDEPGEFCVVSEGAAGKPCIVTVVDDNSQVPMPRIRAGEDGGTVNGNHCVKLICDNPKATIYYTTDGTFPDLHRPSTKVYDANKGAVLSKGGICMVRAVAVSPNCPNSDVFTSKRFMVSGDGEDVVDAVDPLSVERAKWAKCCPTIRAMFTQPGSMNVSWDPPSKDAKTALKGYQLFLNGVSYGKIISPDKTSVVATGLAGGRAYDVMLEAYPNNSQFIPHKSNVLKKISPKLVNTTDGPFNTGGPLVSLETTNKPDAMAIVWPSIDTENCPIEGYHVLLNGQPCGAMVTPEEGSDRCKVVIEGCKLHTTYKVAVAAIPKKGGPKKVSNELEVDLPLNAQDISRPPKELRKGDDVLYSEFVEIKDDPDCSELIGAVAKPSTLSINDPTSDQAASLEIPVTPNTESPRTPLLDLTQVPLLPEDVVPLAPVSMGDNNNVEPPEQISVGSSNVISENDANRGALNDQLLGLKSSANFKEDDSLSVIIEETSKQGSSIELNKPSPSSEITNLPQEDLPPIIEINIMPFGSGDNDVVNTLKQLHDRQQELLSTLGRPDPHKSLPNRQENDGLSPSTALSVPPDTGVRRMSQMLPIGTSVLPNNQSAGYPKDDSVINFAAYSNPYDAGMMNSFWPATLDFQNPAIPNVDDWFKVHGDVAIPRPPYLEPHPPFGKPMTAFTREARLRLQNVVTDDYGVMKRPVDPVLEDSGWNTEMFDEAMKLTNWIDASAAPFRWQYTADTAINVDKYQNNRSAKPQKTSERTKDNRGGKKSKPLCIDVDQDDHDPMRADPLTATTVMSPLPPPKDDGHLPLPTAKVERVSDSTARVSWSFQREPQSGFQHAMNIVSIVGTKFSKDVNSDISFECMHDENGNAVTALQHCWNVSKGNDCVINGLAPGVNYTATVIADYALTTSPQPYDVQIKSQPIRFKTDSGVVDTTKIKVTGADSKQLGVGFDNGQTKLDPNIAGYQVMVDGNPFGGILKSPEMITTIDKMTPGQTSIISLAAVPKRGNNPPEIIHTIKLTCPKKPPAPVISEQPAFAAGSTIIAWDGPTATNSGEDIVLYRVYVDGKLHGEMKSNPASNRVGYQYTLKDLKQGQSCDVAVTAVAGQSTANTSPDHVYCMCESDKSASMTVVVRSTPESPALRIDGMNDDGVDITWDTPQQIGNARITGYQMLKDGKRYGPVVSPETHSMRVKGLQLGDKVDLQIQAITDVKANDGDELYRPSRKLGVNYSGLVQPPSKIWCEQVTGDSAVIAWKRDDKVMKHYANPDMYQVTWWPGTRPEANINSQSTTDGHVTIRGLLPDTMYTVVVEARRMQKYSRSEDARLSPDEREGTFILTAQSDHINFSTASPPEAPTNLAVTATTCNSIQVSWDPPRTKGADVIGIRVDAIPLNGRGGRSVGDSSHCCVEVTPNMRSATVENLQENTEYLMSVMCVTAEYFQTLEDGHESKRSRVLPRSRPPPDDYWLPCTTVIAKTSGTDPATELEVVRSTPHSVTLAWSTPHVYGSNRLQGMVVRWMPVVPGQYTTAEDETRLANHKMVSAEHSGVTIDDLEPGVEYKFIVEAVVSVKMTTDSSGGVSNPEAEKQNRRTTHVLSKAVIARTRAPCEPPEPIITGYTTDTVNLYWEKPSMHLLTGKLDENGQPRHLKLALQGYRLEINGRPHMRLSPAAQSCTLVKCKPGKTYQIGLVALTCTAAVNKQRKKMGRVNKHAGVTCQEWIPMAEDAENDESGARPIPATLPNLDKGIIIEKCIKYVPADRAGSESARKEVGDIQLQWSLNGNEENIRQYNVTWKNVEDGTIQSKAFDPDVNRCSIPVKQRKVTYDVVVEPKYNKNAPPYSNIQHVQVLIPGPPDPPEIWLKSINATDFVVEWCEPRLYGVKVSGYQVYLSGKKVGSPLSSHHRQAIIPFKPKRQYQVSLKALSSDQRVDDSDMSKTVVVNPSGMHGSYTGASGAFQWGMNGDEDIAAMSDDNELIVRVVRVADSSIHLDWSQYQESSDCVYYRIVWSSGAQPAEREVRLPAGEKGCVLHKCYPGTNHFIRLYVVGRDDRLLDRSRQITVQTSAPPDPPIVSARAINFNYIAIQWEKPTSYGDAAVIGYKVFVNGIVEAQLGPDLYTYSFTQGSWCKEYVFQVQAVTTADRLPSRPSDPLVLTWPGVLPPTLRQAQSNTANSLKISWDQPSATEGVKIKQFKLVILEEHSDKPVRTISPIAPDQLEVEVHDVLPGSYRAYMDITIHGTPEVIRSDMLDIRPPVNMDPPVITVTVTDLDERRQQERRACDLINNRDRHLNLVARDASQQNAEDETSKVQSRLSIIEEMLDECLDNLSQNYTGSLLALVTWKAPQEVQVSGYKVLVDGKPYGTMLQSGVKSVRIKLGVGHRCHKVSLLAVIERPRAVNIESNVVEVLTDPFLPFSFFSFLNQAPKNGRVFIESYQETLELERRLAAKRPINQGLLKRQITPPSCKLLDIFDGEYRPLVGASEQGVPTAVLFWSKWCQSSKKTLGRFIKFAKSHHSEYNFRAVACEPGRVNASDRQDLVQVIMDNGWREDVSIRHITSQALNDVTIESSAANFSNNVTSSDLCELLGVTGVPTIVILHPRGYIAWRGRYCAHDSASFDHFMTYILAQVMGQTPPKPDPWDTEIDMDSTSHKKRITNRENMMIHQPISTASERGSSSRPLSAKQPFFTLTNKRHRKEELSVNARPFSASRSPYEEKMAQTNGTGHRHGSRRKTKSTL